MGGLIWDEEMPIDDVFGKKVFLFKYGDFAQLHTFIEIPDHFSCEGLCHHNPVYVKAKFGYLFVKVRGCIL